MKDWGTVRASKQPEAYEIDEFSVWAATNIHEVEMPSGGIDGEESEPVTGWEYDLVQYDKDEYINLMNDSLASTQEAVDFLLMNQ